jgi:hypothetical protein
VYIIVNTNCNTLSSLLGSELLARSLASCGLAGSLLKLPKKESRQKHMLRHWKFDRGMMRVFRRMEDADGTKCVVSNLRGAFFVKQKHQTQVLRHSTRHLLLMHFSLGTMSMSPSPHKIICDRVEQCLHTLVRAI